MNFRQQQTILNANKLKSYPSQMNIETNINKRKRLILNLTRTK